jgi:hypothetical protein
MKKILIVTVLTVCLTLNTKIIRAGCISYGIAGECTVTENEYAQDSYYGMYDGTIFLRAWGTVAPDGPYGNNNVTLVADYPSSSNTGPWPSYTSGQWTVVITYTDSGGDEAATNQYDYNRLAGPITLTAISTFSMGVGMNICRGGIFASW